MSRGGTNMSDVMKPIDTFYQVYNEGAYDM